MALALLAALVAAVAMIGLVPLAQTLGYGSLVEGLDPVSWLPEHVASALKATDLDTSPLGVAVAAFALILWRSARPAEWVHDRAFAAFNDEVLEPVRKPRAFDPLRGAVGLDALQAPLPWILTGPRREVWDALLAFARMGGDRKKDGGFLTDRPVQPFGWTIVMGRPGSGKSRIAVEVARHLGRRDAWGGGARPRLRERLRQWWRVQVLLQPCSEADPWDAGWLLPGQHLHPTHAYASWIERPAAETWLQKVESWRPRRPTFILLDDPRLGDAKSVIATFSRLADQYRHPVRLLIVNQTAPSELDLRRDADVWTSGGSMAPLVRPLVLPDSARFGEQEIRQLRGWHNLTGPNYPLGSDAAVTDFVAITRGNPLLVELGIRWLRQGRALGEMSEERLLVDRVDRVLDALREAGLTAVSHERALAAATLAGGATVRSRVTDTYPLTERVIDDLARVFPNEPRGYLQEGLPAIRPELIGDAFVRRIANDCDQRELQRLVTTAWLASPAGTLRAAVRLAKVDDAVGGALRTGPPEGAGLDLFDLAVAFSQAALFYDQHGVRDTQDTNGFSGPLAAAQDRVARLDSQTATRLLTHLLDWSEDGSDGQYLYLAGWLTLVAAALGRITAPHGLREADLTKILTAVQRRVGRGRLSEDVTPAWMRAWDAALRPLREHGTLIETFSHAERNIASVNLLATSLAFAIVREVGVDSVSVSLFDSTLERQIHLAASVTSLLRSLGPSASQLWAKLVDELASEWPPARERQLQRARAWSCVTDSAFGHTDLAGSTSLARRVDQIAAPWPHDRDFQLERARAWQAVAFAAQDDLAAAKPLARLLDEITAAWPHDRDLQLSRVGAWTAVAFAAKDELATCSAAGRLADEIAARWPQDREMQVERACIWRYAAFAARDDVVACESLAQLVDAIAAPYPNDRDIQCERATAWRIVTFAAKDNLLLCRRCARLVDQIVAPWAEDHTMQLERATAWRTVAFAVMDDREMVERVARLVDRIAGAWATDRHLQLERAKAWALACRPLRDDLAQYEHLVRRVQEICDRWPQDREFQVRLAQARHEVAYAARHDLAACERQARLVDEIAAPWPRDYELQLSRASAWRITAYAAQNDLATCRSHARLVDTIAFPWPRSFSMQHHRAHAWRTVAHAARHDFAACKMFAERVASIAAPWSDAEAMQTEVSYAQRYVSEAAELQAKRQM